MFVSDSNSRGTLASHSWREKRSEAKHTSESEKTTSQTTFTSEKRTVSHHKHNKRRSRHTKRKIQGIPNTLHLRNIRIRLENLTTDSMTSQTIHTDSFSAFPISTSTSLSTFTFLFFCFLVHLLPFFFFTFHILPQTNCLESFLRACPFII